MVSSSSTRTKVFISYSHKDAKYLDQLIEHLTYYERNQLIELWSDKKITAGAQWREEIKRAIEATKVAVLLVSSSFLASEFIVEDELPPLLHAAEKEGAIILPVIVRPSNFEDTELAHFQAVNSPSLPVAKMKAYQRDEFWVKVGKEISKAVIPQQSQNTTISSTQTAIPAISAMQLYRIFRHHGLAKNDGVENNTEYQSEGIHPEGGVVDFTDNSSGQPYTISVFATSTEASQAATILYNGGDNAYIPNGCCMLHVSLAAHASDFALKRYHSIMDTMCKPTAQASEKDQAENISAWVDAEKGGGKYAILAILNKSNEPIYHVIVSIVAFQGAGPRDARELDPHTPFRAFISSVPPGRTLVKVDGGYRGMSFHPGVEIAFVDKANRSWIRKGHGELVSIENNPTSYYNLTGPFSWQLPKTTEKFSPDDA